MSDEVIGTGPLPNVYIDNVSIRTNCVIDLVMNDFTEDSLWYNSQILADMRVVIALRVLITSEHHLTTSLLKKLFKI